MLLTIKDFCTPSECRGFAFAIAKANHKQIVYQYYIDNLLQLKTPALSKLEDGTYKPIEVYNEYKFGLVPSDKKRLLAGNEFDDEISFYAKKKGVSILYRFKLDAESVENNKIHTCIMQNAKLFARLHKIMDMYDLGIVGVSVKIRQQDGSFKLTPITDLALLPNFNFQVNSDDHRRANNKLELNYYIVDNEGYLNLKLARRTNKAV